MNYKTLGQRIKEERIKLHLTQESLAEAVNLTPAYIGQIERGERKVTLDNLVAIVNHLGVTVDYVLSDSLTCSLDKYDNTIEYLMRGRTAKEKILAANILKLIFDFQK